MENTDIKTNSLPIFDTHQHLWDLKLLRLPWLQKATNLNPELVLNKNFLMDEYLKVIEDQHVIASIYVEVNVIEEDQTKEVEYILDLFQGYENTLKAAIIGGYPHSPDFHKYVETMASIPFIKGVRTVLNDSDRPRGMCLEKDFIKGCQLLGELNLSFDLCMRPDELLDAAQLVDSCPKTRFIVDHCGNMPVNSQNEKLQASWEQGIRELSGQENVFCKISGLVEKMDLPWKSDHLKDVVLFCLDSFGENRVCFGSDWPMCTQTGSYNKWVDVLKWIVKGKSLTFQKKFFYDNAVLIYRI